MFKRTRSGDEQFAAMFRNEIRINALLDSPNVPRFIEAGEHEGVPYLALEYIHGADLKDVYSAPRQRPGYDLDAELAAFTAAGVTTDKFPYMSPEQVVLSSVGAHVRSTARCLQTRQTGWNSGLSFAWRGADAWRN